MRVLRLPWPFAGWGGGRGCLALFFQMPVDQRGPLGRPGRGPPLRGAGRPPRPPARRLSQAGAPPGRGPLPAGPQRDECSTRRPLWGPQTARRQANPAWKIRRWKAGRLNEGAASGGGGRGRGAAGAAGPTGNVSRRPPPPPRAFPGPRGTARAPVAGRWRGRGRPRRRVPARSRLGGRGRAAPRLCVPPPPPP